MADRPNDLELSVMELLLSRPEPGYDARREPHADWHAE
jgi:hypothetical protein